jgi:hypothetical protein
VTAAITRPVAGTSRNVSPRNVAAQVKAPVRGYAQAVLTSLARSLQGQPAPVVQQALENAQGPLGVRPGPARLQQLPAAVTAGQPVPSALTVANSR